MAADNTLTSLNTQFKYVQAKATSLLPENAVMLIIQEWEFTKYFMSSRLGGKC